MGPPGKESRGVWGDCSPRDNRGMIERYTLPEMGRVWSEAHKYELWCRVELLVLEGARQGLHGPGGQRGTGSFGPPPPPRRSPRSRPSPTTT